ncbi:hypothetical protein ABZ752_10000 [Streptomyces roseifaciens]
MSRSVLSDLARQRTLYTNEGLLNARKAIHSLSPGAPPIPRALGDQELFEAAAFAQLIRPCHFGLHPLRIAKVRPAPEHLTLVIDCDPQLIFDVLQDLLPTWDPEGDVHGVEGLRILGWTDNSLDLHQPGWRTLIRLTGAPRWLWRRAEQDRANETVASGCVPCWRTLPNTWTHTPRGLAGQRLAATDRAVPYRRGSLGR